MLVEILVALYSHAADNVLLRVVIIDFNAAAGFLRLQGHPGQEQKGSAKYLFSSHSRK